MGLPYIKVGVRGKEKRFINTLLNGWGVNDEDSCLRFEVAKKSLKCFGVRVMLLPSGEVSDVARVLQRCWSSSFAVHHNLAF